MANFRRVGLTLNMNARQLLRDFESMERFMVQRVNDAIQRSK